MSDASVRRRREESIRADGETPSFCSATPNFQLQMWINSNQHTQVVPVINSSAEACIMASVPPRVNTQQQQQQQRTSSRETLLRKTSCISRPSESPLPSLKSAVMREEWRCNYELNLLWTDITAASRRRPSENARHTGGNQTPALQRRSATSSRRRGIDGWSLSARCSAKWTDKVKCSQPIFLIGREGKPRALALSEE